LGEDGFDAGDDEDPQHDQIRDQDERADGEVPEALAAAPAPDILPACSTG